MPSLAPSSSRVVAFAFLTIFLDLVGFGIVLPLMPFYVASMHGSAESVGLLLSLFATAQLFATPILASLSDRVGRRPVILISLAGNAVGMLLFALATQTRMLALLFVSRLIAGATAGNLAACQAAVADVTSGPERSKAMGRTGAAIGLGLVLGPVIGSTLSAIGPWVPPLTAAILVCIDLSLAFFLMPETRHLRSIAPGEKRPPAPSFWMTISDRSVVSVLMLFFLNFASLSLMQVALALFVEARIGWGAQETGRLFGLFGFVSFIVQGVLLGRLTRRFRPMHLVVAGGVLIGSGMVIMSLAVNGAMVILGVTAIGVGFAMTTPVLSALASEAAGPERQGAVLGFAQSSGGLARVICPVFGGFLFARIAPGAPFVAGAVAALLALGVTLRVKKERVEVA